jgi:hypothetical protein
VGIFGDFPFMVSADSADVWARQDEFDVDVSVGVPHDAFSDTGQDWGLPGYRWDVMAPGGYEWLRQRVRRCTELYDGFRIDHLVGFYRTYVKAQDGTSAFWPEDEGEQLAQGERLIEVFGSTGARIIAEALGTVPDFVRESLDRQRVPGMKVLRWEREWEAEGKPFRDPAAYPADSVAIAGTHDTETMAEWWDEAEAEERRAAAEIPALKAAGIDPSADYSDAVRDALVEALFASGSDILLIPIQDIFGWRDGSTSRRPSTTATGPGACPGQSSSSPPNRSRAIARRSCPGWRRAAGACPLHNHPVASGFSRKRTRRAFPGRVPCLAERIGVDCPSPAKKCGGAPVESAAPVEVPGATGVRRCCLSPPPRVSRGSSVARARRSSGCSG